VRLWIFAIDSFGASVSVDGGETEEDADQAPVIVGHQFAPSVYRAKHAMALELAGEWDYDVPEKFEKADDNTTAAEWDEISAFDDRLDEIKAELQCYELVIGGEHSTLFIN